MFDSSPLSARGAMALKLSDPQFPPFPPSSGHCTSTIAHTFKRFKQFPRLVGPRGITHSEIGQKDLTSFKSKADLKSDILLFSPLIIIYLNIVRKRSKKFIAQPFHVFGRRCFPPESHQKTDNRSCPLAMKSTCVHTVHYTVQVYGIINSRGWN